MKSQLQLLRYVRPHWRDLAVVLATMGLGVAVDVLRPWPMKLLVDQVLGQQTVPPAVQRILLVLPGAGGLQGLLLWLCVSTVLIFLAGTILSTANSLASVGLGQRMTFDLGADLFLHVQRLSLLFHSRRSVGDTISRPLRAVTAYLQAITEDLQGVNLLPQRVTGRARRVTVNPRASRVLLYAVTVGPRASRVLLHAITVGPQTSHVLLHTVTVDPPASRARLQAVTVDPRA